MRAGDTIVALSSGSVPSGVSVFRLSGPRVAEVLTDLIGGVPPPRHMSLRSVRAGHDGAILDRGLAVYFPAPNSFTGEDCAELQLHGSPAVVRAVLGHLTGPARLRLAEPGEFTRRAFENGKLDLAQVEGLGDLIVAETESQRALALARSAGGLSKQVADWRGRLADLRAEIEARLDFSDEGDVDELPASWRFDVAELSADMHWTLAQFSRGRIVREGLRVALAGPPNVGKSSLINALANSDVAIVTDEPGTTRDVREVPLDLGGQLVILVDMAGLRETASKAEAEGIRRARQELGRADLVLWLSAADVPIMDDLTGVGLTVWHVQTKLDLGPIDRHADIRLSVKTGEGIETLFQRLTDFAREAGGAGEPAMISHQRDAAAIEAAIHHLDGTVSVVDMPEVAAEELRAASFALARLVGEIDTEHVLDRLFANFCIGK